VTDDGTSLLVPNEQTRQDIAARRGDSGFWPHGPAPGPGGLNAGLGPARPRAGSLEDLQSTSGEAETAVDGREDRERARVLVADAVSAHVAHDTAFTVYLKRLLADEHY